MRMLLDGRLHLIELICLRPTEKDKDRIGAVHEKTYCEKLIRVVNCTPVSWGAERDERDVSHDEKPEEFVVALRLWQ